MPGIVANWKSRENPPSINDEDFFGPVHVFDPSAFEFTPADIIQINNIANYVKEVYSDPNKGPRYFVSISGNKNHVVKFCIRIEGKRC